MSMALTIRVSELERRIEKLEADIAAGLGGEVPGDVSDHRKSLILEQYAKAAQPTAKAVHRGFGRWDVVDDHGNKINTEPLKKEQAEMLLAAI